jgi:hypothetical protein
MTRKALARRIAKPYLTSQQRGEAPAPPQPEGLLHEPQTWCTSPKLRNAERRCTRQPVFIGFTHVPAS